MNWHRELTLICITVIAARGVSGWFGDGVLMAFVGIGLTLVIGDRTRMYLKSKNGRIQPQNR
jgi:hypothetical protein